MFFKSRWAKQKMDKKNVHFCKSLKGLGKTLRCDHKNF